MTPDVRVLRYFLALAEELSFTRAADRIGIAQPALSAQIRRLESSLGVPLLVRTTRSVALTPAGVVLAEEGPAALAALDAVWDRARRVGSGEAGQAVIVYSPSTGGETVPLLVDALRTRNPELDVVARMRPTPDVSRDVAAGEADAGVTRAGQPLAGTRRLVLRRERRGIIVPKGHPLHRRRQVRLSDAARYPVILHARESNPGHHDEVLALFSAAGLRPEYVEPAVSFDLGQNVIRSGRAIGLAGESAAAALPAGTRWIPVVDPDTAVTVYLVLPSGSLTPLQRRIRAAGASVFGRAD